MTTGVQHEQEVRFALVLYGGVSLAIYINGVMQEMLQLVRSTSEPQLTPQDGSANVYRKLGAMLGRARPTEIPKDPNARIKTKFKVDIVSGTSAGGINGIFLAKALANEAQDLNQIQELWFTEGAIESLLNDGDSYSDLAVNQPKDTNSLLNSRRMYAKLLNAFDGMTPGNLPNKFSSKLADEIDLFATTTDIEGVPIPIQLFDNVVYERRYRNAFHFRFVQGERNDFEQDNNPFLAFAARCTSSFPFAFEPMQLCNVDEILKSSTIYAGKKYCHADSSRWKKFYTNYLQGTSAATKDFRQRPFGDGGYLNNAPFSYAVDALLKRQAEVPVDRKLLYVEPSPAHPEEQAIPQGVPNAIENSLDALVVIPGYQTIRNDLMRVLERNRQAAKINKTLSEVENEIQSDAALCEVPKTGVKEIWFHGDGCYRAYYRMRAGEVTDSIATMLARVYSIEEGSADYYALRSLVRAWREEVYGVASHDTAAKESGLENFLRDFDLPYRVRRLRFVLRKLDSVYNLSLPETHPSYADAVKNIRFAMPDADLKKLVAELPALRSAIFEQHKSLQKLIRRLLEPQPPEDLDSPRELMAPATADPLQAVTEVVPKAEDVLPLLAQILGEIEPEASEGTGGEFDATKLRSSMERRNEEKVRRPVLASRPNARKSNEPADLEKLCDLRASRMLGAATGIRDALNAAGQKLKELLHASLDGAHTAMTESFDMLGGAIAARFYHCFDLFDAIQYPMAFNTDIGEAEVVQIIRVSPEDATALGPATVAQRRAKLKGLVAAHFGAFLDLDWRVNDLLWGRLDAAERIITALLPWDDPPIVSMRDQLIDEAHNEILRNFNAPQRLLSMAARQAVNGGTEARINDQNFQNLIRVAAPLPNPVASATAQPGTLRQAHQQFMEVWASTVPEEPKRSALMKTLARSTEITGRILEAVADKRMLAKQAAWVTNAGRALWGLVEISVPRSAGELLAKYWQSLLLLIALLLLFAGVVSGQKGVSGVGWSLLGIAVALWALRTILSFWIRGRNVLGFLRGLLIVVLLLLISLGGYYAYSLTTCRLPQWLNKHGWNVVQPACKADTATK